MTTFAGDFAKESSFQVKTVSDMHSLEEKMLMLHEMFSLPELPERYLKGASRHLYDIVQLYESFAENDRCIDKKLYNALREHRRVWLGRRSSMFRASSLSKLCFIPQNWLLGLLMDDYRDLRKNILFGRQPDFPALIGKIQLINSRVNGLGWPSLQQTEGSSA